MSPWRVAKPPALLATPPLGQVWLMIELFCLALSGMVISQTIGDAQRHPANYAAGQHGGLLLTMALLSLALVPAFLSRLPTLERVLRQRVAPDDSFERCLRQALRRLLTGWLLLSLPLAIEAALLTDLTTPTVLAGPAWLALTLLCSLWTFAAWHGWIAAGWLLPLAPLLVLSLFGQASQWQAWRELGWGAHLAGCLLLPLSLWRLKCQLAQSQKQTRSPAQRLGAWLSQTLRRGRQLDRASSYWLMLLVLMMTTMTPLLAGSGAGNLLLADWGQPLGFAHLARLLFMTAWLSSSLRSRDLHWRRLLAPPGHFRSGLALRLAADNWLPMAALVMLLSLLGVAGQVLIFKRSLDSALFSNLTVALPWLCDLSLALMLALLLRGRLTQGWIAGGLFGVAIGLGGLLWVLLGASFWQGSTGWLSRGWLSSLLELAVAALLLRWAQAVWARKDLHELMRSSLTRRKTGWEDY
ncbi:hypothetical protein [Roseateles albus]|uniref:ABC transporter permease n=1 Tax=Roseateles albus TaxID=2987525 RepID=A0ABT5KFS9_9BURK|nr:hypothetical protein [Roseateles albus]MDC8772776.1 hypothetical protein [Roseateles albus]